MKHRIMTALLLGCCTATLALFVQPDVPYDPSRPVSSFAQYQRAKKAGKVPKKLTPQMRPSSWFYEQRAYPYLEIPEGAWEKAQSEAREMIDRYRTAAPPLVWEEAGPENVPGRIAALAVDPTDTNIIYAGSAAGGVFKTTDHGVSGHRYLTR